ncbi:MAG: glycosyltransferase family 39 protein [Anaerolineales bacterium]|nr:MAG: glycosyltransferase family 39 protein [Anaerolineales bacterium]
MQEPSVLDYLKALLSGQKAPAVPPLPRSGRSRVRKQAAKPSASSRGRAKAAAPAFTLAKLPWRSVGAFVLFFVGQILLAPPGGAALLAASVLLLAVGLAAWAYVEGEWSLPQLAPAEAHKGVAVFRRTPLLAAGVLFVLAFLLSGNNQFNLLNVACWLGAVGSLLYAFWQPAAKAARQPSLRTRLAGFMRQPEFTLRVSRWSLLVLLAFGLIAFFRFHQFIVTPPEMVSDHAEMLMDVLDIQNGKTSIFFERNTGREPLPFYLAVWVGNLFGTGASFLTLKLASALVAFASLAFMYLLGKELGGRWVGLFALLLTGLAYWPNVLSRLGLNFGLYAAQAAPTLYYLLRGLRRSSLNDFLLAGLFMGIGLNGYTAFRIVPLVAAAAVAIFLLHRSSPQARSQALLGAVLLAVVAIVAVTPLLRFAIDNPALVNQRVLTRLGEAERAYPGPAGAIFVSNVLNGLGLFNYSGGTLWVTGAVRAPAFDPLSGALLLLGVCLAVMRYARHRQWQDLFLLLSIPLLMLPSTLSLAFPEENPAMNRASAAWIPAFLLCALALDAVLHSIRARFNGGLGLRLAQLLGVGVLGLVALLNYGLFFGEYTRNYTANSWNSREMGQAIADYANSFGSLESAWVVAYPHWVDTRLVAMEAGKPGHDYAVWPEQLANTASVPAPRLYLLKPEDTLAASTLQQLFPQGVLTTFTSQTPTRDFLMYLVAADN